MVKAGTEMFLFDSVLIEYCRI